MSVNAHKVFSPSNVLFPSHKKHSSLSYLIAAFNVAIAEGNYKYTHLINQNHLLVTEIRVHMLIDERYVDAINKANVEFCKALSQCGWGLCDIKLVLTQQDNKSWQLVYAVVIKHPVYGSWPMYGVKLSEMWYAWRNRIYTPMQVMRRIMSTLNVDVVCQDYITIMNDSIRLGKFKVSKQQSDINPHGYVVTRIDIPYTSIYPNHTPCHSMVATHESLARISAVLTNVYRKRGWYDVLVYYENGKHEMHDPSNIVIVGYISLKHAVVNKLRNVWWKIRDRF